MFANVPYKRARQSSTKELAMLGEIKKPAKFLKQRLEDEQALAAVKPGPGQTLRHRPRKRP